MKAFAVALSAFAVTGCATAGVEEPAYTSLQNDGAVEIRVYEPTILAETKVSGEAVDSRMDGFSPLADYIFAKGRGGEKIAMTAPVTQEKGADGWTIGFTMPSKFTMDTLPRPVDEEVQLVEQPGRKMVVIKYSGLAGEKRMAEKEAELQAEVLRMGMEPIGETVHAFYDPPWTLPFLRRNEVMVEVRSTTAQ